MLANPYAEDMFGYGRGEMAGVKIDDLVPERFRRRDRHTALREEFHHAPSARSMGNGRDLFALRQDGSEFPVEIGLTPVRTEDGQFVLSAIVDITERRRLEDSLLRVSESEQKRIGQDIHDDVCQQLAGVACLLEVLKQSLPENASAAAKEIERINAMVADANTSAREISRGLVPSSLASGGFCDAIQSLAERTERVFNVMCCIDGAHESPPMDERRKIHLYRIAQEAVNNAIRHGKCSRIRIYCDRSPERFEIVFEDNGGGFDESKMDADGMGLLTMRHRAKLIGGELDISSEPGKGTRVSVSLPIELEVSV